MAEPLVNSFGLSIAKRIADAISAVWRDFDHGAFVRDCRPGYESLNLMQRGRHIALHLQPHLPARYEQALPILLQSFDHIPPEAKPSSLASFVYLPYSYFIAEFGLNHLAHSLQAQYQLTQRFTAEFCIRPFLLKYPDKTLKQLQNWINDDSEHVRRLISEGTRPRLPWGIRLKPFQHDPTPVLALLEQLKDDPSEYVRRSVANNLNDIGKDHPEHLLVVAEQWRKDASPERLKLIKHALRSVIKQGDPRALQVLDVDHRARINVNAQRLTPKRVSLGEHITISAEIHNPSKRRQKVLVDYRIHFVKANGDYGIKVFKLKVMDLGPGESLPISKNHKFALMTTRTLYAGLHRVDLLVNGQAFFVGDVTLKM